MQVSLCWTFLVSLQVGVEYWDFLKLVKLILILPRLWHMQDSCVAGITLSAVNSQD